MPRGKKDPRSSKSSKCLDSGKAYTVKLHDDKPLLGMPAGKKWDFYNPSADPLLSEHTDGERRRQRRGTVSTRPRL